LCLFNAMAQGRERTEKDIMHILVRGELAESVSGGGHLNMMWQTPRAN
jgi:hypothetical protein